MDSLVSTEWLASELGAADLRIIDATFFLPTEDRDARAEYQAAHIPGAVFLDLEEFVDSDHAVPNMLPPAAKFVSHMQSLGIGDADRMVV
jgi:thiosulfate/3-mercaptopyruvate sulfurtransferase